jgi:hypothetical protein
MVNVSFRKAGVRRSGHVAGGLLKQNVDQRASS